MSDPIYIVILYFAGGVALFLLGMKLLTDGLKIAAGETLRSLLANFTSTMFRGICSGILITGVVQSSSAVIFATIGFVNAGLMSLLQAAYVILGSNVGTTFTGWIVATVGVSLNLPLLAMPMLTVGMILWLVRGSGQLAAMGQAMAGFSLFFLGIDILKSTFEDAGALVPFDQIGTGFDAMLIMFVLGILLTTVMQSSSAAIAVVITAAAGGLIPLEFAAVLVVGADIGTTSTALFAVIGATSNAKRAAVIHVLFNVLKVPLVLPFLSLFLWAASSLAGDQASVAVVIALFHTFIKVAGLLVMLPFTSAIVGMLNKRFTKYEQEVGRTRFIDETLLSTPSLATSSLIFELKRIGRKSRTLSAKSLEPVVSAGKIQSKAESTELLSVTTGEYIQKMQRGEFPPDLEHIPPQALRVIQYFGEGREHAIIVAKLRESNSIIPEQVKDDLQNLELRLASFLELADSEKPGFSIDTLTNLRDELESVYEKVKTDILRAGSSGAIQIHEMVRLHDLIRSYRRMWDQYLKAAIFMDRFNELIEHEPGRDFTPPYEEEEYNSE